jgi:hypothetical protein
MKKQLILLVLLFNTLLIVDSFAQTLPLVYEIENTGTDYPKQLLPPLSQLPSIQGLPDPFHWADGRGRIQYYSDWRYRRAEIGAQIQNYEIGPKPAVDSQNVTASYSNGTLTVDVTVNGKTLTLTAEITLPSSTAPFPAIIGVAGYVPAEMLTSGKIATIAFHHNQVTTYGSPKNSDPYYQLYPYLNVDNTGQYSAWAWGISRIIDGLKLVQNVLPIDLKHIAVNGCSYAGKLALFAGAFDERIALTIAQESGGGGATSWRYSRLAEPFGTVECIDNTDYNWFMNSMIQFSGNNVLPLPEDHHELMAMCAPRALLVTANPGQIWLSNPSCYVCSKGCQPVYNALGIPDRFGFSLIGGHSHCSIPTNQVPEIAAFVNKFLLGIDTANTNITTTPYTTDLSPWITWTTPTLSNGNSFIKWASLAFPSNQQKDLTKSITFKWNKVAGADKYFIYISLDPAFANIALIDSIATDTVKTVAGLLDGKRYYWRIQAENIAGASGPFSEVWNFATYIPLPAQPQLIGGTPYPDQPGGVTFMWNKVQNADQYLLQLSYAPDFSPFFYSDSTASDTVKIVTGLYEGLKYYWRVQAKNVEGSSSWSESNYTLTDVKSLKGSEIPSEYSISQNYPNPFNPATKINFALPQRSLTKLTIYDLLGREVQMLINKELEAGYHEIQFDAINFPSGVYYYRIQSGDFLQTKKMILIK